mmetsp:Transcript_7423/g.10316  ORF Transcript_7423/g.10316 Transcript_7423/m.10316 type:complete len:137 (-) Transcript_7423:38-448(-)
MLFGSWWMNAAVNYKIGTQCLFVNYTNDPGKFHLVLTFNNDTSTDARILPKPGEQALLIYDGGKLNAQTASVVTQLQQDYVVFANPSNKNIGIYSRQKKLNSTQIGNATEFIQNQIGVPVVEGQNFWTVDNSDCTN